MKRRRPLLRLSRGLSEVELHQQQLHGVGLREEVELQPTCKEMRLCLALSSCRKARRPDSAGYLGTLGVFLVASREDS